MLGYGLGPKMPSFLSLPTADSCFRARFFVPWTGPFKTTAGLLCRCLCPALPLPCLAHAWGGRVVGEGGWLQYCRSADRGVQKRISDEITPAHAVYMCYLRRREGLHDAAMSCVLAL
jgi:hypothetical protein